MLYSQMRLGQRSWILDEPANYPLRVAFLGKRGILGYEEVAFLRREGVDFDVDDRQTSEILAKHGTPLLAIDAVGPHGCMARLATAAVLAVGFVALLKQRKRSSPGP